MNNDEIKEIIRDIVSKIAPDEANIAVVDRLDDRGGLCWFELEVSNAAPFLRYEGEALHSLNHLVKKIAESKSVDRFADFLIDVNGFQKKRIENIRALAHMMAERARYFKSNIEIDPMSPFERRIVHEFLSDATDLKTESEGVGRTRRVVIKYLGGL